jgi:ABC-type glycerol-3-phosphate transport system permease component
MSDRPMPGTRRARRRPRTRRLPPRASGRAASALVRDPAPLRRVLRRPAADVGQRLVQVAARVLPEPDRSARELGFRNFTEAWELANFPRYMLNSLIYTSVATALFVIMSVFVAFPIARGYVKGSGRCSRLYVVALFLPPALIPQFQLILNLGLFNTRQGYILLFLINPIGMIILVNYIKSIPRELDESAAVDGCGYVPLRPGRSCCRSSGPRSQR